MHDVEQTDALQPQDALIDLFAHFIQQLSIYRRHLLTYPEGHPLLSASGEKALALAEKLFSHKDTVQCTVVKKRLYLDKIPLVAQNRILENFAASLSSKGIVLLKFKLGLSAEEISRFCTVLNFSPDEILARGGLEKAAQQGQFQHIEIAKIDYGAFRVAEGVGIAAAENAEKKPESLWEHFARKLHAETTDLIEDSTLNLSIDPAQLAEYLNTRARLAEKGQSEITQGNVDFLLARFEQEGLDGYFYYLQALENFSQLIENLSPTLRSQFMQGIFKNHKNNNTGIEKILKRLSSKTILKILNDVNSQNMAVSRTVFNLLGNLSKQVEENGNNVTLDTEVEEKLKFLFKEDLSEQFLDEEYRQTLNSLIGHKAKASAEVLSEIPSIEEELSAQKIEVQHGQVVLALLNTATDKESQEDIKNNLFQTLDYFLETCDFAAIQKIHTHVLSERAKANSDLHEFYEELLQYFERQEFTENVLAGLHAWDRKKLHEIESLITCVGYPFVPPLLKLLAEESKRTARRFILDQLYAIAPKGSLEPILAYLTDGRWYVVRNMILLLRTIGDHTCIGHLEKNMAYPHPKVRFEIIKTLLHFQHPLGVKYMLQDLGGPDPERRSNAILLAKHSQSQSIRNKLLELLANKGFSTIDLDTKKQIIRALATIDHPDIITAFQRILNSVHLIRPGKHNELKKEKKRSLSTSKHRAGMIIRTHTPLEKG